MVYYLRKYLLTLCLGDCVTNFVAEQLSLYKHSFPRVCVHAEVNICVKYLMKVCSLRSPGIFSSVEFTAACGVSSDRDDVIYMLVPPCSLHYEHLLQKPAALLAQQII